MSRHLVCSVGTAPYDEVTYRRGEESWPTRYGPVAVARLLALSGSRATVLVTPDARDAHYDAMAHQLAEAGLTVSPLQIPEGRSQDEILTILARLVSTVQAGEKVVLDVTFAFRHLPFIYFTALTCLTAQRGVELDGIFYGLLENGSARLIDLTSLFRLVQWYHALQAVHDSGDLRLVAHELRSDVSELWQAGAHPQGMSAVRDSAARVAQALASGLPVEVGRWALQLLASLERAEPAREAHGSLLALENLKEWTRPWAIPEPVADKSALRLSTEELERQLRLARWYAKRHDLPKALPLLREWLVSAVMYRKVDNPTWLSRAHRKPVEDFLNGLARRAEKGLLDEKHRGLAAVWSQLGQQRNKIAHAGMTEEWVSVAPEQMNEILSGCQALWNGGDLRNLEPSPGRSWTCRLLVTCLGLSAGVLYSAVLHTQPTRAIIVTSVQARSRLAEALDRAGYPGLPCHVLSLRDPHSGFTEGVSLVDQSVMAALAGADEVVANITGGTTIMQYVVERIARKAGELGVPSRVVALVDRRPPEVQRDDPYVLGELIELASSSSSRSDETGTTEGESPWKNGC